MTRKGTTILPAGAEADNRERGEEIYLYEGVKVQSSSASPPVAAAVQQGLVVENSFEELMGAWYLGMNNGGGGGDIFMGMGLPGGGLGGSSDMEG